MTQSARLVLVPDVGKEQEAERIAREVRGLFVMLPEGWEQNADVNDYAQREGFDALEALLSAPLAPEQRFKLLGSADLHALPPLAWRVRGVLPAQGMASIYGPSGSGKSFLALDMAAAIAEGRDWFGYRVNACPVVYCLPGRRRRVPAARRSVGEAPRATAAGWPASGAATVQADRAAGRATTWPPPCCPLVPVPLTFIDTLNAAAPGIDENASQDMGRVIEAAKDLQGLTGGLS